MNATFNLRNWLGCSLVVAACQSAALAGGFGGHFGGHSGGMGNNVIHNAPVQQKFQTFKANNNVIRSNQSVTPLKLVNNKVTTMTPVGGTTPVTGGTKVGGGLKFPNGGVISVPPTTGTNPTGGGTKFPGGLKFPTGGIITLPPTTGTGTGTNPTGGGKFPGGGIKLPPGNIPPVIVADPPLGGGKFPGGGIKWPPGNIPPVVVNDPPKGGGGTTTPPTNPPTGGGTMPPSGGSNHHHGFPYWMLYSPALYGNWGLGYGGGYGGSVTNVSNVSSAPVVMDSTPAAPAPAASPAAGKLTLKLGQNYTIANENFGENMGGLALTINGLTLPVQIDKWDAQQVSFTMPAIGLGQAVDGMFQIVKSDRNVSRSVPVMVMPAQ